MYVYVLMFMCKLLYLLNHMWFSVGSFARNWPGMFVVLGFYLGELLDFGIALCSISFRRPERTNA